MGSRGQARKSESQHSLRMGGISLLLLLTLSLTQSALATPVSEEEKCGFGYLDFVLEFIAEDASNIGPMAAEYGFGDHIDWNYLESYSISDSFWKHMTSSMVREMHEHFKSRIAEDSVPPIQPYRHWNLFRPPNNVNDLWVTEVSLASDHILHYLDKINMVLHGGFFSEENNSFYQYREHKDRLELLTHLSEAMNYINLGKNLPNYLMLLRDSGFQQSVTEYMDENLAGEVDCLYTTLGAKNLTFYNTLAQTIPKERLVEYCLEFISKFFNVINSEEIEFNIQTILTGLRATIRNTDFDRVFSKIFLSFLRSRSLVLDVDVMKIFENLDDIHRTIGEGWWSLTTGQWPEMEQFISTFLRKTVGSRKFWHRVDELYHELVAMYKAKYLERERWLEESIRTKLLPFMRSLMAGLEWASTKDKYEVTALVMAMSNVDIVPYLEPTLDTVVSLLSRHYLACYTALWGKPDFTQMAEMSGQWSVVSFVKSVVVTDWPEEQRVPENWPRFVEKLQDGVLVLVSACLGSCSRPVLV